MKIVFRVDTSLKIGIGHLMRCLTLANELKQQNHEIVFICRKLKGNLISLIKYPILMLTNNDKFQSDDLYLSWLGATQEQDSEQTIRVIPKNTDLLIVDSYALDEIWHKQLRPYTKKIMVIDDLADRQFDCDVMLNQNLGIQKEDYKEQVPDNCELLLGCEYALLRPEFPNLRERALEKRKNTKEIKNILISLGGYDPENLTYNILKEIRAKFDITVVLGGSSPHNVMIKNYAKTKNISVIIDANNMAELMIDADLAVGASGSTSWERCCMGLPTLLLIAEDNQREIAKSLTQLGAVKIIKDLSKDLIGIEDEFTIWQEMSAKAQEVCNGLGSKKVAQLL